MKKKLDQYRGLLTLEQIAAGMNLASRNALRLYRDAISMINAGSYPTALSLAALSIEEAGKGPILRRMASASTEAKALERWREYRSHTKKNVQWAITSLIKRGGPTSLEDFRPLFDEDAEHPYLLDQLKQLGLYSDCLGDAHWSDPVEVIDESLARDIVAVAGILCRDREVTVRELQLWRHHMGGATEAEDLQDAKQRLADWYAAMQSEGLFPPGANAMEAFVSNQLGIDRRT